MPGVDPYTYISQLAWLWPWGSKYGGNSWNGRVYHAVVLLKMISTWVVKWGVNPPFKETPKYKGNWKIRAMHEDFFFRWCHRMTPEKGRPDLTGKSVLKRDLFQINSTGFIGIEGKKNNATCSQRNSRPDWGIKRDHVVKPVNSSIR